MYKHAACSVLALRVYIRTCVRACVRTVGGFPDSGRVLSSWQGGGLLRRPMAEVAWARTVHTSFLVQKAALCTLCTLRCLLPLKVRHWTCLCDKVQPGISKCCKTFCGVPNIQSKRTPGKEPLFLSNSGKVDCTEGSPPK